jgi:hypothetical protein
VEQGAATSVFLAASPLAEGIGGRYFEDVNEADTRTESPGMFGTGVADYALEPRYAELLWEVSAELVAAEKYSRQTAGTLRVDRARDFPSSEAPHPTTQAYC